MRAIVLFAALSVGCSDWTPVRTARDLDGQRVKVEAKGESVVIDEVSVCDRDGYLIARRDVDCQEDGPPLKYDTRREKVSVHAEGKTNASTVVAIVIASILIPAAIAGSIYLSGGI